MAFGRPTLRELLHERSPNYFKPGMKQLVATSASGTLYYLSEDLDIYAVSTSSPRRIVNLVPTPRLIAPVPRSAGPWIKVNDNGTALAVVWETGVSIVNLPYSLDGGRKIQCHSSHINSPNSIRQVLFHPLANNHIYILNCSNLLGYSLDSGVSSWESAVPVPGAVDFAFSGASSWNALTIVVMFPSGSLSQLCPIAPSGLCLTLEHLSSLADALDREKSKQRHAMMFLDSFTWNDELQCCEMKPSHALPSTALVPLLGPENGDSALSIASFGHRLPFMHFVRIFASGTVELLISTDVPQPVWSGPASSTLQSSVQLTTLFQHELEGWLSPKDLKLDTSIELHAPDLRYAVVRNAQSAYLVELRGLTEIASLYNAQTEDDRIAIIAEVDILLSKSLHQKQIVFPGGGSNCAGGIVFLSDAEEPTIMALNDVSLGTVQTIDIAEMDVLVDERYIGLPDTTKPEFEQEAEEIRDHFSRDPNHLRKDIDSLRDVLEQDCSGMTDEERFTSMSTILERFEDLANYVDTMKQSIEHFAQGKELTTMELKRYKGLQSVLDHHEEVSICTHQILNSATPVSKADAALIATIQDELCETNKTVDDCTKVSVLCVSSSHVYIDG